MLKIMVGLPTNRFIKTKCADSVLKMVKHTKYDVEPYVSTRGYNTAENRNHIATRAITNKCSHLFLIDDDMIYEPDTIDKLIESEKDIVGGLYYTKYEKQEYVIESDEIKDKTFICKAIGGGLLMIKTEVLMKIPQPHFGYLWYSNGMVKESNDWYFCRKARESGYKIWCNPDIKAKHIGLKEF